MGNKCILCGSTETSLVGVSNGYEIVKCKSCSFQYCPNIPDSNMLEEGYSKHIPKRFKKHTGLTRLLKYYPIIRRINKYHPNKSKIKLLEIGCSQGRFLSSLKIYKQFDATGVDLTDVSIEYARSLGLNVLKGPVEKLEIQDESYDVIVGLQVVEHLPDPVKELKEYHRILRKGGILYATMPCVSHFKARRDGINWKLYGPPGHIWYFSPETYRILLSKTGFEPVYTSCFSRKAYLTGIARKV